MIKAFTHLSVGTFFYHAICLVYYVSLYVYLYCDR